MIRINNKILKLLFSIFVFMFLCVNILQLLSGRMIFTDNIGLIVAFLISSVVFYLSFWGDLTKQSYDSAFDWKFYDKGKISYEKYRKSHNTIVALLFIIFIISLIYKFVF